VAVVVHLELLELVQMVLMVVQAVVQSVVMEPQQIQVEAQLRVKAMQVEIQA
jgi:hypothetical protein